MPSAQRRKRMESHPPWTAPSARNESVAVADPAERASWLAMHLLAGALAVAVVAAACYVNSLNNGFHYDDTHSILENSSVLSLDPRYVWEANSDARFVSMYSFSLSYAVGGFRKLWAWHAANIAVHAGCALLVFGIFRALPLGRHTDVWALAGAALFAVHPLCTEPVNYIQARSAQLVLFFALAAGYFTLKALRRHWLWALPAVVCAALGARP